MGKRGNGEGHIRYDKKRKEWVAQYTAGRKDNGKPNRPCIYGKTRAEVSEKLKIKLAEVQAGTYINKSSITLLEIIDLSIEQKYSSNKIRQTSYNRGQQTKNIVSKLPIANMQIQKITIQDINLSLNQITNYSNSVIDKVYCLIRQAYGYAILNEYINKDFFSIRGAIIKPKSDKQDSEVEALTIDEQQLLLNQLQKETDSYKDIILILLYTGMRVGEVLALKTEDIDIENRTIHITKTLTRDVNDSFTIGDTTKTYAGKREVPILDNIYDIMSNLLSDNEYLFESINNSIIRPTTINSHFKRIAKRAGIETNVKTHMLRHTFATRCIEAGMSPVVLQKILGHKNIEVTLNTYTSVFDKYKDKELDKIQKYFDCNFDCNTENKTK